MSGRTVLESPAPSPREADAERVADTAAAITGAMRSVIAGRDETIELVVGCLLSGGHLLIEDIPGVGKTLIAQTLAAAVGGSFHRIQGTPDLLPGDVTGTMMPQGEGFELRFRPGPIFSNVVVFDELNRANPRTQSALLEATEEAAVTVDGVTRVLPDPFLLVATQNPLEMVGTYPLGEGALDRFAAILSPGRPSPIDEVEVLTGRRGRSVLSTVTPVVDIADLVTARAITEGVFVADQIAHYVVALLEATREHPAVRLGASTRAGVSLIGLAKARAAMTGRHYVVPDDILAVVEVALSHRVIVSGSEGSIDAGRSVVAECSARVPAPSA